MELDCSAYSSRISEIVRLFGQIGWRVSEDGAEYYPLHDDGDPDWQQTQMTEDTLFSLIDEKQCAGEHIGVILYHVSGCGIMLTADNPKEICLGLDIDRKTTASGFTDFSWYLEAIAAPLEKAGCILQLIRCEDLIG